MAAVLIIGASLLGLVGIGTLILDRLFHLDVFKVGWRKAAQELPEFAAAHGLEFTAPTLRHEMGSAVGSFNGRDVRVLPDERARLEVLLRGPELQLSTSRPQVAAPENMQPFETGRLGFDRFFKTRYAGSLVAAKLVANAPLVSFVEDQLMRWWFTLRFIEIGPSVLRCSVIYGQASYLPAHVLDELLPELCELARLIEETRP